MIKVKRETGLIAPVDKSLSLEERGILAVMLNDPDCDYKPIEEIYDMFQNDSKRTIETTLSKLFDKGYIIKLQQNIIAVNKIKICNMQLIRG